MAGVVFQSSHTISGLPFPKRYAMNSKPRYFHKHVRVIHRVRDRMVVGFTTTYAISAYHH